MYQPPSGNYDLDINLGIRPFKKANLQTEVEFTLEKRMIRKRSNNELMDKRNGLTLKALGDKNFKFPDYCPNFFKEGQLIPGQNIKWRPKTIPRKAGTMFENAKLPKQGLMKTYKQREADRIKNLEIEAV